METKDIVLLWSVDPLLDLTEKLKRDIVGSEETNGYFVIVLVR